MACALITAQDKKTEKAKETFDNYAYAPAISSYEDLVDKGYSDEDIFKNLGDANYHNAMYSEAAKWYAKLFALEDASIDADYMYRYAQSLKSSKDYEASNIWLQKYQEAKMADVRAIKIAENPDYLKKIENNSGRYDIRTLTLNSSASDFAPAFKGEQLVFSTARDSGTVTRNIHTWNNQPFTNLYVATDSGKGDFDTPTKLSSLNKKTHETSAVFTRDGSTVYFTRNNSENGNFSRDQDGVSRLKIYRANLKDGLWTNIKELPFNADNHSAAHPALSPDERKLYFASDMEGTTGASDIFVVDINEDGSVGTPKNLGKTINTEARETFPFVSASNILYFASDGHPGLGGLDVFATSIEDMNDMHVVNVGKAVNSEQDDFSYIINEETKKGYFTSNRDGGAGDDDIYGFTETKELDIDCHANVTGVVKDQKTGLPIGGANLVLTNANEEVVTQSVSDVNGNFSIEGDCGDENFKIVASKIDYNDGTKTFMVSGSDDTSDIEVLLDPIKKSAPVGTDLAKYLNIEPIYFDFDKWNIRADASVSIQKVINYMKEYVDIKVQVQSHTDVRGNDTYNEALSERRADSTTSHMIANGIDASRIVSKGFGEKQLTNDCTNQAKCSEEKHQENRRSEFIVIQ